MQYARWLLIAAGAVTAVGLAAPVHADNTDTVFLDELDRAGIEYADAQDAVSIGKDVCDYLAAGRPVNTVVRALKMRNHHLSMHNAAQFVAISAQTYCPAQLPAGGISG
ncbi:DUF732 domain-containing protein [Mycobacterium botniense]|uniref:DUF732 domain-containing protein n=1 Tax=Mycobacterium botniense TaxID=84962 RepID=A0A7I9XUA4_9MYCO|nr:DUF732 domain-containing protein [Mycobacterium botniense]GFG73515.1 hypothetical protein MBOT_08800 [Mycobacterium botniense]